MDDSTEFLLRHGYAVLFVIVLAGQLAIPIPSIPLLLAAGALANGGRLSPILAFGVAVAAGLLGDCVFFVLGRRYGRDFLALLCRMSLEPVSCVDRAEETFERYGVGALLMQRFLPWLGT